VFTVIPLGRVHGGHHRELFDGALARAYSPMPGPWSTVLTVDTLMIRPPSRSRRAASRSDAKVPFTFAAMTLSNSSSVCPPGGPQCERCVVDHDVEAAAIGCRRVVQTPDVTGVSLVDLSDQADRRPRAPSGPPRRQRRRHAGS